MCFESPLLVDTVARGLCGVEEVYFATSAFSAVGGVMVTVIVE